MQQRNVDKLHDLFLNGEAYLKRPPEKVFGFLYDDTLGTVTSVTADQVTPSLTTEHLQKLLEELDTRVKAASVETVTDQTLQQRQIKLEFDSPHLKLEHYNAVERRWSFTGFMLVEDERMVEPHISWHDVRSMGRAKRRHARGFRQNLKRIYVPQKTVIVDKGRRTIIGHPATIDALVKHIKLKEVI